MKLGELAAARDFTYVENVVEANLMACTAPKAPGEVVNIACGDRVTIAGLCNMIGEIVGWTCEPKLKPARPGDVGLGDPFAMPYVTIEALLPLRGDRVAIVNDTNFGSTGRNPMLPDYSDFIVVKLPHLKSE